MRHARYAANQRLRALRFGEMGFKPYLDPSVQAVVKVGDTVSDIREGRNAGVRSLGVLEGSSVMGMTQVAFEATPLRKSRPHLTVRGRCSSRPAPMMCC